MTALRKVLVVDDDPVVGASFRRVLSGRGYLVVSAESGTEAMARLHSDTFDAVFTDLRMPGMDGMQVAEKIRAEQPWLPVVIVTGYGSAAQEARARAAGVSAFLHKPLSPDQIAASAELAVTTAPEVVAPLAAAVAEPAAVAAAPTQAQPEPRGGLLRNMALFLVAPFVGLVYAVLLPFVGLGMLLWVAFVDKGAATEAPAAAEPAAPQAAETAAAGSGPTARDVARLVGGFIAAPFIGLAYIIALPFAGLGALAWMGLRAAFTRR